MKAVVLKLKSGIHNLKNNAENTSFTGRAKTVIVFSQGGEGTNGGLRVVLDTIAESIKAESTERYIRDVFDRHVAPNAWDKKVEIIRQFINQTSVTIGSSINKDQPERYAQNYQDLIRSYVNGLQRTSSIFRRL